MSDLLSVMVQMINIFARHLKLVCRTWIDKATAARHAIVGRAVIKRPQLLAQLIHDEGGSYIVTMTLVLPIIVGTVGFGTEGGLLLYNIQRLQSAADSAAVSAATAFASNGSADISTQAKAITATYGFVDGANNVTVVVNNPPQTPPSCYALTSPYAGKNYAVEVIVRQPQTPLFSALWLSGAFNICGRAVAVMTGGDCLLALGKTSAPGNPTTASPAIQVGPGMGSINLPHCGIFSNSSDANSIKLQGAASITAASVGTVGGVNTTSSIDAPLTTGGDAILDPYRNRAVPSSPSAPCTPYSGQTSPGRYCGPISIGGTVNLSPGVYILDSTSSATTLTIKNGTLTGTDVTLVFTSSSGTYPSTMMSIQANGNVNLSAPSTGTTAGIVIFGDRTMPIDTVFDMGANGTASFNGAVYLPNGKLYTQTANNDPTIPCTQFIANTIVIKNGTLQTNGCIGNGTTPFGTTARLVE